MSVRGSDAGHIPMGVYMITSYHASCADLLTQSVSTKWRDPSRNSFSMATDPEFETRHGSAGGKGSSSEPWGQCGRVAPAVAAWLTMLFACAVCLPCCLIAEQGDALR